MAVGVHSGSTAARQQHDQMTFCHLMVIATSRSGVWVLPSVAYSAPLQQRQPGLERLTRVMVGLTRSLESKVTICCINSRLDPRLSACIAHVLRLIPSAFSMLMASQQWVCLLS